MSYKPKAGQPNIAKDVKRPGSLTARAERNGRSVNAQAETDQHKGDLAGEQARYYLNVLKPASHANALKSKPKKGR